MVMCHEYLGSVMGSCGQGTVEREKHIRVAVLAGEMNRLALDMSRYRPEYYKAYNGI